jgi:hypothetical protein
VRPTPCPEGARLADVSRDVVGNIGRDSRGDAVGQGALAVVETSQSGHDARTAAHTEPVGFERDGLVFTDPVVAGSSNLLAANSNLLAANSNLLAGNNLFDGENKLFDEENKLRIAGNTICNGTTKQSLAAGDHRVSANKILNDASNLCSDRTKHSVDGNNIRIDANELLNDANKLLDGASKHFVDARSLLRNASKTRLAAHWEKFSSKNSRLSPSNPRPFSNNSRSSSSKSRLFGRKQGRRTRHTSYRVSVRRTASASRARNPGPPSPRRGTSSSSP